VFLLIYCVSGFLYIGLLKLAKIQVFLVAIRLQPEKMVAVICIMVIATSGKANNFKARVSFYLPSPLLMPPSTYIYPLFSL
jgi:hypothetical protein